jgi:hypothetical protein
MTTAGLAWCFASVAALAFLVAAVRDVAATLWVSMGIALAARIGFAMLVSVDYTPRDARSYFHSTGQLVLDGKDPLLHLPGRQWNFLQLMPYIHALEIKTGWSWVYAVKIAPIACDVLVVWLIYRLAGDRGPSRALQYALNPLSLFIVSLHGQVEPVALALAMGGVLLARRRRWFLAGVLLGAATAAKTWPVLIALAVLPISRARRLFPYLICGAIVPVLLLLSGVLFLDTRIPQELKQITTYSSYIEVWGWAGYLVSSGHHGVGGYGTDAGHIGSVLTVVAGLVVVFAFRRHTAEARALALVCSVLIVTAGFGQQYLLWPLPLMFVVSRRAYIGYVLAATPYLGIAYLSFKVPNHGLFLSGLSWLVIYTLIVVVWETWKEGRPAPPAEAQADVVEERTEAVVAPRPG